MSFFLTISYHTYWGDMKMIRIKCFMSNDLFDLEEQMNEWIQSQETVSIFDCKFQTGTTVSEQEMDEEIVIDESLFYTSLLLYRIDN